MPVWKLKCRERQKLPKAAEHGGQTRAAASAADFQHSLFLDPWAERPDVARELCACMCAKSLQSCLTLCVLSIYTARLWTLRSEYSGFLTPVGLTSERE